jgi:glycosyltransferase involved in cell wall biosynthesis
MKLPEISVLMPVYNSEKYLKEAIDSILNPTFNNFELLVFDDCSTDRSVDIIKGYRDERIKLIQNNKNLGIPKNLNRGIDQAKGKYLARMDADDICIHTRFEKQYQFMESFEDIAVCGTWVQFVGSKKKWLMDNILKNPSNSEEIKCWLLFNCVIKHPSVMIRKKILDQYGFQYNEKVSRAEDYDLWVRISKNHALSNIEEVLLKYRIHESSVSRVHRNANIQQSNKIRKNLLSELGIKCSKKELDLHHELSQIYPRELTRKLLSDCNDWLYKIYISNKKTNIYDEYSLLKILSQKWNSITKTVSRPAWMRT